MTSAAVKVASAPVQTAVAALVFILVSSAFAPQAMAFPGIDRNAAPQTAPGVEKAWGPGYGGGGPRWGGPGWGGPRDGWGGPRYGWGGPRWGWGGPRWRRPYWGPRYGWGGYGYW